MSCRKPGYYQVPEGKIAPELASTIMAAGPSDSWVQRVAQAIGSLGRGGRRVASLTLEDVLAMGGEEQFAPGQRGALALQRLMLRLLAGFGMKVRVPAVLDYTVSPYLTMDEIVDAMLSRDIKYPTMAEMGGEQFFNLETLRTTVSTAVRELAYVASQRPVIVNRLRTYLGHIAWKVSKGQALDQAELTFYLRFWSPYAPWARTSKEEAVPPIKVAETADPLVLATWAAFRESTLAGPYLRYAKLVSNKSFEDLVYWFGPVSPGLKWQTGYVIPYAAGAFIEPVVHDAFDYPWKAEDQLQTARERRLAVVSADKWNTIAAAPTPVTQANAMAEFIDPGWDLPDVKIHLNATDVTDIAPQDFSFLSHWRKRRLYASHGYTPQTVLMDIALAHETHGGGEVGNLSIADWPFIDMALTKERIGSRLVDYTKKSSITVDICYPREGTRTLTDPVNIDLGDLYDHRGRVVFPPAFKEFCMVPREWLFREDATAEAYIIGKLGLTYEQSITARLPIRLCYNYGILSLFFSADQMPMTFPALLEYIRSFLGYNQRVGATEVK